MTKVIARSTGLQAPDLDPEPDQRPGGQRKEWGLGVVHRPPAGDDIAVEAIQERAGFTHAPERWW